MSVITRRIGNRTCRMGDGFIDSHMKLSKVPVSHDGIPHLLSSCSFLSSTLPSSENTKLSHPSLSHLAMIKSIHRVQHTLSTAYTVYFMHRILHHPKINCLPLAASLTSRLTMLCSILYIPSITSQPMNRVSAPVAPPFQTTTSRLTPSMYSSTLTRSWPPSASPNSLDHRIQVHL